MTSATVPNSSRRFPGTVPSGSRPPSLRGRNREPFAGTRIERQRPEGSSDDCQKVIARVTGSRSLFGTALNERAVTFAFSRNIAAGDPLRPCGAIEPDP